MAGESELSGLGPLLLAVIENLSEGLVVSTRDGQMLHWNQAAIDMHGYRDRDECLRRVPEFASEFTMTSIDGAPVAFEQWPFPRILRGEKLRDFEVNVSRPGWERVFSYTGSLIMDPDGRELAFVTIKDVTVRHEQEQALRESNTRARGTLDRMIEGCQIIDREYRYVYLNEAAAAHGRADRTELVGRTMMEAYPGIEQTALFATLRECMETRAMRTFENAFSYPDGTKAVFELVVQAVPEGILISSLDVTAQKLSQEAVLQLNTNLEERVAERTHQLQQANHELEAFSYSVSHDLRAPLRAVDGYSHALVEEHSAALPEEAKRYVAKIRHGAQRMGALIDDLLTFSRLSRSPLKSRTVDMNVLVKSSFEELPQHERVELRVGELPSSMGDPALLKQVWVNLLSNAVKYTAKSESPLVEVGAETIEGELAYFVRDNGTGFDMRFVGKLFGVFQRLHREDEYEGTGVGLAIVKRVIDRHGGWVWAHSDGPGGRGATFHFSLGEGVKA